MSKKIKILFPVGALYPNESGGVSISLYWLLKGLYQTNILDLTVITSTYGIAPKTIIENEWINSDYGKVIYLNTKHIYIAPELIKLFLREVKKADIIHLSSIFYPPTIVFFFISLFYKKKVIWSTRGSIDDVEFQKRGSLKNIIISILKLFTKKITFHSTSDDESSFIRKRFGKNSKIKQITNYIVLPEKIVCKKENFFFYIGRFHQKKGINNLLIALKLSKLFIKSNFTLKIAGDYNNDFGKEILELHKNLELKNKVIFLGAVTGDIKQVLLAKSYFTFMPSYSENFGIVAAEALAQGTPVVASFYTPWEYLNTYQAGFWVDNQPQVLADIIDIIISMPNDTYQLYVKNTEKLINKELNIFTNTQIWLESYQELYNV